MWCTVRSARIGVLGVLFVALGACNSGDDGPSNPPTSPPSTEIPPPGNENPPPTATPAPGDETPPGDKPPASPPAEPPAGGATPPPPPPANEELETKEPGDEPEEGPGDEPGGDPIVENSPPVISGTPPTSVVYSTLYRFEPTASDADGDILHFSIKNAPPWASFDRKTGTLTGTPGLEHIGEVYKGIKISVTDGAADAELEAFGITVLSIGTGSVELSWLAPTENVDGSSLEDLAGFRLYWGRSPGKYDYSVTIDNPAILTYRVEGLAPATYYFAATAFNAEGAESDYSNEVRAAVPGTYPSEHERRTGPHRFDRVGPQHIERHRPGHEDSACR